jgi:dipeptidyl aminopeptidase/acylaminoacyl peptidase
MNNLLIHSRSMAAHAAIVISASALVAAGCADMSQAAKPAGPLAVAPAALRLEGVPALDQSLLEAARRYNGVAGHGLMDWHPKNRELLVSHRAPGTSTTQLFRLRTPMGALEPLTAGSEPIAAARWEPREGRYLVFARGTGGDEAYQLYRLDPETRATTQLTPGGQRHALVAWIKSRSLMVVASVPLDRTATGGSRSEITTTLSLIDPLNPAARQTLAELPGGGWFGAAVSPDETQLAIGNYMSATQSQVWLLPLKGGERRRLLPAPGQDIKASHSVQSWSADGRSLLVTTDRAGEFNELMRLDLASGTIARLGPATPWDVERTDLSEDGQRLAMSINADGRDELRVLQAGTGEVLPLPTLPGGSVIGSRFHAGSGELAFVVTGAQGPGRIHTLNLQTGAVTAWTQPVGAEGLNLAALPNQEIVRWRSFDGRSISGVLTLPPARFTGKRPVVMLVHGGPEGQAKQGWQGRYNYLVQEMGVALFEPNVRGSSGFGKTYLALDDGMKREDSVKDMGSAIDWMATQPRLDAQRVLVMGGSYGGYMALAASTRLADKIAGAVATVGISNFVTFLQNTESYRRDLRRVEYGDERDPAMRAFLQEISPLTHVERITRPLFVVQGKNDPRVPWTESEQVVRSLQKRGTPVWYMLADNEGHGFVRRENTDYAFTATVKFIAQTLKP